MFLAVYMDGLKFSLWKVCMLYFKPTQVSGGVEFSQAKNCVSKKGKMKEIKIQEGLQMLSRDFHPKSLTLFHSFSLIFVPICFPT